MALPLLVASCSNDDFSAVGDEAIEVSFSAQIPLAMGTRASAPTTVDRVYCAVFENGNEIKSLREEIEIVDGQDIRFTPRLMKGRTYNVVFWAAKDGSYDVSDLTSITRNTSIAEENFDAFTATTEITVGAASKETVVLARPHAQLNIGINPEDWAGVQQFGIAPKTVKISFNGKSTFNALEGIATGTDDEVITYELAVPADETLVCNGKNYKKLASCYVLATAEKSTISSLNFSIYDENSNAIRENVEITFIPLQKNYKTNVVGGLLTGTVTYTVTFDNDGAFNDTTNDKTVD